MNLILTAREIIRSISEALDSALNQLTVTINTWANVEHHPDGTHGDVTAESLDVSGTASVEGATTLATLHVTGTSALDGFVTVGVAGGATGLLTLEGPSTGGPELAWNQDITQRMSLAYVDSVMNPCRWHDESGGGLRLSGSGATIASGSMTATTTVGGAHLAITDGVTAPSAIVGLAQIYVDIADGDLKVIFGDGIVKTLATDS